MIYLLLSIFTSTLIFIAFKLIARNRVNTIQAIVVNYVVCVIEGSLVQRNFPPFKELINGDWLIPAVLLGSLFISVFYATAMTVKFGSMAMASIANKLSLIIPTTLAFFLYNDPVTISKIAGILVALVAVVLTSYQKGITPTGSNFKYFIFPALVLAGSGIIDASSKYCQESFVGDGELNLFLIAVFGTAGLMGCLILVYRKIRYQENLSIKSIGHGLLLGIPNYGTMYFLIAALNHPLWGNSSTFFPINNICIVLTTSFCGWLIFKEKLNRTNFFGILLAVISIGLITYGFWK